MPSARRAGSGDRPSRYVLVVDDNVDAANSIAALLRRQGQEVDIEALGAGAIRRLKERVPDMMLLDIGLPDISGYEVAREARNAPGGDRIRIFGLTGYGQDDDRRRSADAGFDGLLVKPIAPSDLILLLSEGTRH